MGLYGSLRPTYRIAWTGRGHRRCAETVPFGSPGVGSDSDVSGQHDKSGVSAARFRAAARSPLPGPARGAYPSVATEAAEPRSEEHTTEHQSPIRTSYAVLCLKKTIPKKTKKVCMRE